MAKPKLALIPAAQGTSLYSVLPSSGVGDFSFTRSGSATRINAQGLIETVASGVSRLNYQMIDGVVKGCPHHILEPQRTNLVTYSEDFNDASWIKTDSSVTSGFLSLNGTLNADKLIPNTDNTPNHYIRKTVSISNLTDYSYSFFAKKGEYNFVSTYLSALGGAYSWDLENGVVIFGSNAFIENYGNGWYRCGLNATSSSTSLSYRIYANKYSDRNISFQGDGTSGVYIWGAQLEESSYPTSYIKTTSAAVTRSAETANGSGDAATFNNSEGVLMLETAALADSSNFRNFSLSDGSTSNLISFILTSTNVIRIDFTNQAQLYDLTTDIKNNNKILVSYKLNEVKLYVNGFLKAIDTNATMPTNLNTLRFDNTIGEPLYSKTKQIQYFDTADIDLEQLTSWVSFQEMAEAQLYTIE